ncbi:MAG: YjbQ family protein [Sphingobacteriia bacterium]|nr:YjbQ family protein [Sphingobacteriia bacterium]
MVKQSELQLPPFPKGFHLITRFLEDYLKDLPETGLVNVFIQHTSAGITINENADSTVRSDMHRFFEKLVPDHPACFDHYIEGPDDMPAHVKATLVGSSVNIPVSKGRLNLGTWQGIYLGEFRNHGGGRKLVITVFG